MNLPNLISLARLLSVPLEVYLILHSEYELAFWLFVLAGISDAVDGWVAKGLKQTSWLGSYLDPIADKTLLIGVFVTLGVQGQIPSWLVILVVFRDLMILGGVMLQSAFVKKDIKITPSVASKVNTAVQIIFVALVLANLGLIEGLANVVDLLSYLVALTTVMSGAGYVVSWAKIMASMEDPK